MTAPPAGRFRSLIRCTLLAAYITAGACASLPPRNAAQPPALWGALTPGPHATGLRIDTVGDVALTVWYPARPHDAAPPVTFATYLRLAIPLAASDALAGELATRVTPDSALQSNALWTRLIAQPMHARLDAAPAPGSFPLLLWSARHEIPAYQAVLSEFLASHGYIVVSSARTGDRLPYPFEIADRAARPAVLEQHLAVLDRGLTYALQMPNVDANAAALLAWSYGGESASMLQRQRPEVRAVVSFSANTLDGWVYQQNDTLPQGSAANVHVPYVLLSETTAPNGAARTVPPIAHAVNAPVTLVWLPELRHGNFNMIEGLIPGLHPEISVVQPWSRAGDAAAAGYAALAEHALHHLDRVLRPDARPFTPMVRDTSIVRTVRIPTG